MTWPFAQEVGGGPLEFELVIEGFPYRLVTDGMEVGTYYDGRERIHGLQRPTGTLKEQARLASGLPEVGGFRVSIVDLDLRLTEAFTTRVAKKDWVDAKISTTVPSISARAGTVFDPPDVMHIGTEAILYGRVAADRITDPNTSAASEIRQSNVAVSASTAYVASLHIRKDNDTSRFPELILRNDGGSLFGVQLNTKTGAIDDTRIPPDSSAVTDAGEYWRVELRYTTSVSDTNLDFRVFAAITDTIGVFYSPTTGSIVAFGAQLEQGSTATAYEKTGGSAGSRNLLTYSEAFDNAAWTKDNGATVTPNIAPAPGEIIADTAGSYDEVVRGYWDTTPQTHHVQFGRDKQEPALTDRPTLLKGRRCELYAWGPTETGFDPTQTSMLGTGLSALVWRGVIRGEPEQLSGGEWSLGIDPITKILEQEVGGGLLESPLDVRGVYYAEQGPLVFQGYQTSGASYEGLYDIGGVVGDWLGTWAYTGFSGSQADFIDDLNTWIASKIQLFIDAAGGGTLTAVADGPQGWKLVYETAATNARFLSLQVFSVVDGMTVDDELRVLGPSGRGSPTTVVNDDARYEIMWRSGWADDRALRQAPRACYLDPWIVHQRFREPFEDGRTDYYTTLASAPATDIYVRNAGLLASGDKIKVTALQQSAEGGDRRDRTDADAKDLVLYEDPLAMEINAVTASSGKVELIAGFLGNNYAFLPGAGTQAMPIADLTGSTDGTDLDGFRQQLVARAAEFAGLGSVPAIRSGDVADWSSEVSSAAGTHGFLKHRFYTFREAKSLKEILEQEARIYGGFFRLDAQGRLDFQRFRQVTPTEEVTKIGEDDDERTAEIGRIKITPDQVVNVVTIKTGWDPVEEEHIGDNFEVRAWQSISQIEKRRTLEIEPEIQVKDGEGLRTWDDAYDVGYPVIGLMGSEYYYAEVPVSIRHFDVLVGDPVEVTDPQVPYNGSRGAFESGAGLTAIRGFVVGREWQIARGTGKLLVYITGADIAGYSPSGKIASATNTSGDTWELTLTATHYAPPGLTDASFFKAGDFVEVHEWNTASPTRQQGTVDSVSGDVVTATLTFPGSWGGAGSGTGEWRLLYGPGSSVQSSGNAAQLKYCLTADAAYRLITGEPARVFAV